MILSLRVAVLVPPVLRVASALSTSYTIVHRPLPSHLKIHNSMSFGANDEILFSLLNVARIDLLCGGHSLDLAAADAMQPRRGLARPSLACLISPDATDARDLNFHHHHSQWLID